MLPCATVQCPFTFLFSLRPQCHNSHFKPPAHDYHMMERNHVFGEALTCFISFLMKGYLFQERFSRKSDNILSTVDVFRRDWAFSCPLMHSLGLPTKQRKKNADFVNQQSTSQVIAKLWDPWIIRCWNIFILQQLFTVHYGGQWGGVSDKNPCHNFSTVLDPKVAMLYKIT